MNSLKQSDFQPIPFNSEPAPFIQKIPDNENLNESIPIPYKEAKCIPTPNKEDKYILIPKKEDNKHKFIFNFDDIGKNNPKFKNDIKVIGFIGSGSSGYVYEGEMIKNYKKVALKLLTSSKTLQIKREIIIQSKLKHKNIPNVYGNYQVGENNEDKCIIMELAKHGDLINFLKLIRKKILNETLIAYIAKQILIALEYCKNSNILHLDVKPQNILVNENLQMKLADYSVAFELPPLPLEKETEPKITLSNVGTPFFISPEILSSTPVTHEQAFKFDIFSFGVLLYFLAFGYYPFNLHSSQAKNYPEVLNQIRTTPLVIPIQYKHSSKFRNFLEKLLKINVDERYSVEEALKDDWMKSADLIFEEAEKIGDLEKILINLVTDNFKKFNESLNLQNFQNT